MKSSIKLITNYEYKKQFLPDISATVLSDEAKLQVYRIENYLRRIVIPVQPYRTSFNFLIFVTRGFIRQQLETATFKVETNQVLNIKQGSITRTLELSDDVEGFFVIYENEIITNLTLKKNDLVFFYTSPFSILNKYTVQWLVRLLELLEEELYAADRTMEIGISLFQSILLKMIRTENKETKGVNRSLDIAFQFRELVKKNHIEHKSVLYYAGQLNISENYLNKCVKEVTGKPPKQWINEISILHSQILLQDSSRDIAGIAFELNYQSPSYFARLFKKVSGQSPSAFRLHMEG